VNIEPKGEAMTGRKEPNPPPPEGAAKPPPPPSPPRTGAGRARSLWVVGKIKSDEKYQEWEFVGVFDSRQKARIACRTPNHFLGAVGLNRDVGDAVLVWPENSYPMREEA
jgi:hypothetical protein